MGYALPKGARRHCPRRSASAVTQQSAGYGRIAAGRGRRDVSRGFRVSPFNKGNQAAERAPGAENLPAIMDAVKVDSCRYWLARFLSVLQLSRNAHAGKVGRNVGRYILLRVHVAPGEGLPHYGISLIQSRPASLSVPGAVAILDAFIKPPEESPGGCSAR